MIDIMKTGVRPSEDVKYAAEWLNARGYEGDAVFEKGKTVITARKNGVEKKLYLGDTNGMIRRDMDDTMKRFERRFTLSLERG